MREFEIEIKNVGYLAEHETMYTAKSKGFEADITVFNYKHGPPFVHKHFCKIGGEKLWRFEFWNDLQTQVINYHKKLKEEKENEKENC